MKLYYYEPNGRITVGDASRFVVFEALNKVEITESVRELGNKARIVLPRNYKELAGKGVLEYIKVGDPVKVELGFDGRYYQEFTGFISEVESGAPLVLHCDDEFYPLKQNSFNNSWKSVSLKTLLHYVSDGLEVSCPDVELGNFEILNVSTYRVLWELQRSFGFYSWVKDGVLNCHFGYDLGQTGDEHTYTFYDNVKKNDLKYKRAEDVKVRVKGISNLRNGKKLTFEVGPEGRDVSIRTLNFGPLSEAELKKATEEQYKKLAFDGYNGSVTGFAYPRTHAGDTLKIVDREEPDREGRYRIEKTVIRYGLDSGFERENTLSFKL